MKKIFFALFCFLGIVACASGELPLPDNQNGVFRGNLTQDNAESVLFDACTKARWQVTDKSSNSVTINFDHKGYNFDAVIHYTNSHYSIKFKSVNQDRGSLKKAYAVYKKYVTKLNRVIQKTIYNTQNP